MALLALSLDVLWLVLAFGVRPVITWRRTGDAGFRRIGGRLGGAAWWGGVLFVVALVAGVSAPVAAMAGLGPLPVLQRPVVQAVGLVLAVVGGLSTLAAQGGMGAAWRVGVDPADRTELVTDGVFRLVRNPVFTAMIVTSVGLALVTPNLLAAVAVAVLWTAIQIQVRRVEELYLRQVHGPAYLRYAATTGRFGPALGVLRPGPASAGATDPR